MRFTFSILFLTLIFTDIQAQNYWTKVEKSSIENFRSGEQTIFPTQFESFALDAEELKKEFAEAPKQAIGKKRGKSKIISIPFPSGELVEFDMWEASVMAPKLAAKFPNINSYKGLSTNGKYLTRISFSDAGLHAVINTSEGTIYIDPIFPDNPAVYQSYYIKNQEIPEDYNPRCGTTEDPMSSFQDIEEEFEVTKRSAQLELRKYRFALACTGEYANIVGGTVVAVMEQFNIAINRLNQVYELNCGMTFELIENNDDIIFLDPDNDPYINTNMGGALLGQNITAVGNAIGNENFDVGHVFTRNCVMVGGIAQGSSACNSNKAAGVSCIGGANTSSFAAGTMAHEVGHQFSAGHTWNNCQSNDPDSQEFLTAQLAPGSAYEPGSGSTILSYSGACGTSNTGVDDDYFSVGTILEITRHVREDNPSCGVQVPTNNEEPIIIMPYEDGFYIPKSTPFILDASAIDENDDDMWYSWDQFNLGPSSPLGSPTGNAPSFVPVYPDEKTKRYFPRLSWVRANTNRPVEVLPTYARDLNFQFVVRDRNPEVGSVAMQEIEFHVAPDAGPFFVTQPNFNAPTATVGQELEVLWDVSNTDMEPVNCQFVNILLSTNDGLTFDRVLARNTPNDGQQVVRIPNAVTLEARVKVEAADNIFYDMSNSSFIINEPTEPTYIYDLSNNFFDVCSPAMESLEIQSAAFVGYSDPVEFSILSGLPDGTNAEFTNAVIQPDSMTVLSFDITEATNTGEYEVILQSISGTDTITQPIYLNVTSTLFDDLTMTTPVNGASSVSQLPTFEWTEARNAERYIFELATSPAFGESTVIYDENVTANGFTPEEALEKSTLYYWRITPFNKCGIGETLRLNTFGTVALSCNTLVAEDLPKNISPGAPSDVFSEIFVPEQGMVSVVTIKNVKGKHQKLSNLTFSIISPSGSSAILVSNECFSAQDFDCGFDDASPVTISCPFSQTYMPEEPLSIFNGEEISGNWRFNINDASNGNGGVFEEFELQLCSNAVLNAPLLIRNEELLVLPGAPAFINSTYLEVEDSDNLPEELTFTLVDLPTNGYLELSGQAVEVGTQFTQKNLNSGYSLKYFNTDPSAITDQFTFTCIDGNGGWIDITAFNIGIDENGVSSTEELVDFLEINILPNPTKELSTVTVSNTYGKAYQMNLINMNGQILLQEEFVGNQTIEINAKDYPAGIYLINLESEGFSRNEKLIVLR